MYEQCPEPLSQLSWATRATLGMTGFIRILVGLACFGELWYSMPLPQVCSSLDEVIDLLEQELQASEPPCGCWERNPDPLQEQPVLLGNRAIWATSCVTVTLPLFSFLISFRELLDFPHLFLKANVPFQCWFLFFKWSCLLHLFCGGCHVHAHVTVCMQTSEENLQVIYLLRVVLVSSSSC